MITTSGICVEETDNDDAYADFIARKQSADELSLMDAAREGQRAGEQQFGGSMNPFQDYTPEYVAWERARLSAVAYRLSVTVAQARKVC